MHSSLSWLPLSRSLSLHRSVSLSLPLLLLLLYSTSAIRQSPEDVSDLLTLSETPQETSLATSLENSFNFSSKNSSDIPTLISSYSDIPRSVNLPLGTIIGAACDNNPSVTQYYGIPYAEPMLGMQRFRRSTMYGQTYPIGGLNATEMPPPCGSYCGGGAGDGEDTSWASEDCLFLNIWVPPMASLKKAKLPVRVYIHGGSIVGCSASDPQWNGCIAVTKTNVIQVNIQFRMGVFGMLADPATFAESNTTGNWGLLDQQLALKWVQKHIEYFGGDPTRVLLNGHSSGGQAVDFQMVMPGSNGLYSAAIAQSSPCTHFLTLEQGFLVSEEFKYRVGCSVTPNNMETQLHCLRSLSWTYLMEVTRAMMEERPRDILMCDRPNWQPFFHHVVDGTTVPNQLLDALKQGGYNKVPYMTGVTTAEGATFVETFYDDDVSDGSLQQLIEGMYPGADPTKILNNYPPVYYKDAPFPTKARLTALWTDIFFTCPMHKRVSKYVQNGQNPVYTYMWGTTASCPKDRIWLGPVHAVELWFTFGIVTDIPDQGSPTLTCNFTKPEVALSNDILTTIGTMANETIPRKSDGTSFVQWSNVDQKGTHISTEGMETVVLDFNTRCSAIQAALLESISNIV